MSVQSYPATLFHIVRALLHLHPPERDGIPCMACCDVFARDFTAKIDCTCSGLGFGLIMQNWEVHGHPSGPILWDVFQIVQSEVVDGIFGKVWLTF